MKDGVYMTSRGIEILRNIMREYLVIALLCDMGSHKQVEVFQLKCC